MGSVTFNDSYFVSGIGQSEQNVRINFSESYSASSNSTTVTFASCEIASNLFLGNCVVRGKVQFNGSDVKTYPTTTSSYTVSISGGTSNYSTVTGGSGSSITVWHDASGRASFTVKLVALEGSYFGAAYSGKMFGVAGGSSKSVSLTTHTSTLTVNPNGGTWSGSTSSQSFSQAPTSAKSIGAPSRTGYTFSGWTLSGGGSWNGTTYTFGASNGTLTANWTINTWTVSYDANGGSDAPASQTKTYGQTLVLTADVPTRTGYTFKGWATTSDASVAQYQPGGNYTANEAATLYAVWEVLSYTLSITQSDRGVTTNALRAASPIGGAPSGLLNDGDTIYYGDSIKFSWSVDGAYQIETFTIDSEDVSALTEKTIAVYGDVSAVFVVEMGAIVYINNDMYQVFINDGTGWSQYQAFIGNGSSWEAY